MWPAITLPSSRMGEGRAGGEVTTTQHLKETADDGHRPEGRKTCSHKHLSTSRRLECEVELERVVLIAWFVETYVNQLNVAEGRQWTHSGSPCSAPPQHNRVRATIRHHTHASRAPAAANNT